VETFTLLCGKFIRAKLYKNRSSFVEDVTKTYWCFFCSRCIYPASVLAEEQALVKSTGGLSLVMELSYIHYLLTQGLISSPQYNIAQVK